MELQYVQLTRDKTAVAEISSKTGKLRCNEGASTELYCLFIAADNTVDVIGFIRNVVLLLLLYVRPPVKC